MQTEKLLNWLKTKNLYRFSGYRIYYFKDIAVLKNELQSVLNNNIIHGGEYQINDGIKQMMAKGMKFVPGQVDEWMDCGNKNVTVETNTRMLGFYITMVKI